MAFLNQTYAAVILITLTLVLQCAGMTALIHWVRSQLAKGIHRFGYVRAAALMVQLTHAIFCMHVLEILLWAGFYRWKCFATWESASYFSATSYSTVGYGDLILQPTWRMVGPVEGLTGVLMCGLSASLLFAIVTRLVERDERAELAQALALTRAAAPAAPIPADGRREP
jgi:voltage-gated potassium channel